MPQHFDDAPGLCHEPDAETQQYRLNHTMVRIKDPEKSLDFYTQALGMRLIRKLDFEDMQFTLYFLGYLPEGHESKVPSDPQERTTYNFGREALVELTHNWGDENDPNKQFHNGNEEPKGYGHIGVAVPDVESACQRLENLGVPFQKQPNDGNMKGIAFVRDPDGYWVELFQPDSLAKMGRA
ncbi:lactoylglutathione lyase [Vreelandella utahensis]|uniref:lactoylglutathione lyase n=1 Tax=Vreelandella halophila TaxID=86177 RepID=UPI000986CF9F|nr:lactoylglutathione lyase [Halomonas utahensis]